MGIEISFVNLPLEVDRHPKLTPTAKRLFWIVDSVCKNREFCRYTNTEFANMLRRHPRKISAGLSLLIQEGFVISSIEQSIGNVRRLAINPLYKETYRHLVEDYNVSAKNRTPIAENGYRVWPKTAIGVSQIHNKTGVINEHVYSMGFRMKEPSVPTGAARHVYPKEEIEKILIHWNCKGKPLVQHKRGTKTFLRIKKAATKALKTWKYAQIIKAIDIYYDTLIDPTLFLHRYKNYRPAVVNLDEFFEFGKDTLAFIRQRNLKSFFNMPSWCWLCIHGNRSIRDRFTLVRKDTNPKLTAMLRARLPPILNLNSKSMETENILRSASCRLTEVFAQVRARITNMDITRNSAVAFARERFVPYMEDMEMDNFQPGWLRGERIYKSFVSKMESDGFIKKPVFTRTLKRRVVNHGEGCEVGCGDREADCDWDDSEYGLPEADNEDI